jgi:hypothetical protein
MLTNEFGVVQRFGQDLRSAARPIEVGHDPVLDPVIVELAQRSGRHA